jgi:prophage regulatory protein
MRNAKRNATAASAASQSTSISPEPLTKVFKPVAQKYPVAAQPKKWPRSQNTSDPSLNETSDHVSFMRLPKVIEVTGLKKTSVYNRMREKTFPLSVQLGPRTVGWIASEVDQWVAERIAESRPQPATVNLLRPSARASST